MAVRDLEGATCRFLQHFFSLLDAREPHPALLAQGEEGDAPPLLQVKQRAAIGKLLPEWARLLLTQATEQRKASGNAGRSDSRGGAPAATSSFYLDGDVVEGWFAFPHLALISSPWTTRRVPPPRSATRHRLLRHLQQRYECGATAGEERNAFVQDMLRSLSHHKAADGRSVEQLAFMHAVESLFPHHLSSQCHQEPPVALVAAALFSEWCAASEGDASFASTRVSLQVIADDLAAYRSANNSPAREGNGGATTNRVAEPGLRRGDGEDVDACVVVGTLAGLACAYPMTTTERAGADRMRVAAQPPRKRGRGDDTDDDNEDEEDDDDDDDDEDYGGNDSAEDEEENTSSRMSDGYDKVLRSRHHRMNAFVRRNTTFFRVPLASLVLNVFHVRQDGTGDAVMERHIVPTSSTEAHFRRGELLWFSVGESKRHRSMLE
ncbi:hypothetical protein TraAM80_01289 [Trypanosoma rangeli]|uniref:Uncharacterized protein n=1 Tax=Trypanosoma rangeli TaxID=5698 RepID=A0A422NZP3_TRYRA|nr:uncharacterized protein TraAM80_01289 [Trypanosoma rangeli]RNF10905.1 hypothetical protein TraAM80_01289 [Trypanosoma rangeli]|eukprot:RNF10905.1 hypothetical protein TraAM80_01289 [Trypanosoma rangeli]